MNELYELPNGWEWKKLGDTAKIIGGGTPRRNINEYWENGNIVWLSPTDLGKIGEIIEVSISKDKITQLGLDKSSAKLLPVGTVLYSSRATIGKIAINSVEVSTNQGFSNFVCNDNLSNKYLAYCLNRFTTDITSLSNSTTFKEVSKSSLKEFEIPLPPLQEQKRIVSKLDILFEKIDKSIVLHQKNMDETDVFMGSVLNEVFGELEEKYQLENIGNMIEILTDYHSNGAYKTLKANVELLDSEDYALMIRATDLEKEDYTNNVKYITEKAYHFMSKSKVYGGEIILPKIGTIGSVYFMPYLYRPISLAMNVFMIRCSDNVDNKYLYSYLKSPKGYAAILSRANGAVTKTITKDAVRSIELPLPPLNIQQKTVKYLDQISEKTEKVKSVQKEKMESLKALKASLLDRAFRGEL